MSDVPAPTRAEEGRYTVVYEGDPAGNRILNGEPAVGRAVGVMLGDLIERAAQAEAEVARLTAENERLHIAFLVLSESGHGGGMYEVRRWFNSGTAKPIPWPGGACFEAWAAEHSIFDCNGAMGFRRRDALKGGADAP